MALMVAAAPVSSIERASVQISRPWAQMVAPGEDTIAIYATVVNARGDTLTSVSSPAAASAAIYLTLRKGGRASLYQVSGGLPFAANQPLFMDPDGTQIRLTRLKPGIAVGQTLSITLNFARAGTMSIDVLIEPPADTGPTP